MGLMSVWHWAIVLAIVILLFGRGRISALMSDFGRGIGLFKREIAAVKGHKNSIEEIERVEPGVIHVVKQGKG